jgi:hypothetical protein
MATPSTTAQASNVLYALDDPFSSSSPAASSQRQRKRPQQHEDLRSPQKLHPTPNKQRPLHGFFLPPPPGLTLPAPSSSRALQERSINLPGLEAIGCKRRRISAENFVVSRDATSRNSSAPAAPQVASEVLERAIQAIDENSLRALIQSVATADASIAIRVVELQRSIRERTETLRREKLEFQRRLNAARAEREQTERYEAEREQLRHERKEGKQIQKRTERYRPNADLVKEEQVGSESSDGEGAERKQTGGALAGRAQAEGEQLEREQHIHWTAAAERRGPPPMRLVSPG